MRRIVLVSLAARTLSAIAAASDIHKRTALDDCLHEAQVPVDEPDTRAWSQDVAPFNMRLQYQPIAIAVPTNIKHIQDAVACAVKAGVKATPKCGGHSYASLGLGGEDGHLVLELDRMSGVTLRSDNTAVVQGGARLGHVAVELWGQGERAISHGTCPGVGIGGHALHGGFGMSSFSRGLALDWIIGATVVLANSTVIHCSAKEHPDVFWALKGAGSAVGVVAEFEFDTFSPPSVLTHFEARLDWDEDTAVASWLALQDWVENEMPPELNMRYSVNSRSISLDGLYEGNKTEMEVVVRPLLEVIQGNFSRRVTFDWIGQLESYALGPDLNQTHPYSQHETFYSTSLATKALTADQMASFLTYRDNSGRRNDRGTNWWILIDMHGGKNSAIANVPASASSYAHRDKLWLYQFYDSVWGDEYPEDGFSFLQDFMASLTSTMKDSDYGMYINYADSQLDQESAQKYYWRDSLPRLQKIKAAVDPDEVFYNPLGVRPAGKS